MFASSQVLQRVQLLFAPFHIWPFIEERDLKRIKFSNKAKFSRKRKEGGFDKSIIGVQNES